MCCNKHFGHLVDSKLMIGSFVRTRYGSLEDVGVHFNQAPPKFIHTHTRRT